MAKPATVFTDPREAVLTLVRDQIVDVDAGAVIPDTIPHPFVLVAHDATATRYPVDETATIRVTVFDATGYAAVGTAQTVRAAILSTKGTAGIRATRALTGPVPVVDPETGQQMATFTVAVHTRPSAV